MTDPRNANPVQDISLIRFVYLTLAFDDGTNTMVDCEQEATAATNALLGRLCEAMKWPMPQPANLNAGSGYQKWEPSADPSHDNVCGSWQWWIVGQDLVVKLAVGRTGTNSPGHEAALWKFLPSLTDDTVENSVSLGAFDVIAIEHDQSEAAISHAVEFAKNALDLRRDPDAIDEVDFPNEVGTYKLISNSNRWFDERLAVIYPCTPEAQDTIGLILNHSIASSMRHALKAEQLYESEYKENLKPKLREAQNYFSRLSKAENGQPLRGGGDLSKANQSLDETARKMAEFVDLIGASKRIFTSADVGRRNLEQLGCQTKLDATKWFQRLFAHTTLIYEQLQIDQTYIDVASEQGHSAIQMLELRSSLLRANIEQQENILIGILAAVVGTGSLLSENFVKELYSWCFASSEITALQIFGIQLGLLFIVSVIVYFIIKIWQK